MTLHIFNPDHDLALASGLENFTAPHAGRQLRHDLGWLPALWADKDDCILVDDVPTALKGARHRPVRCHNFVNYQQIATLSITKIEPWGWNAALCGQLHRSGLPTDDFRLLTFGQLDTIRELSHRRTAAHLLPLLQTDGTVGEAVECTTIEEVGDFVTQCGKAVLKAPWSSSGRGIRFTSPADLRLPSSSPTLPPSTLSGWLRNTLQRQGAVMAEPQYTKVKDFGMEFHSDGKGQVIYQGLSLFHTSNGAYTGNVIATEQAKRELLGHYLPTLLLDETRQRICQLLGPTFKDKYRGPFGIDMMVVKSLDTPHSTPNALHPCVEINLRRTMGHVAIALASICNPTGDDEVRHVMRINYFNNNYKLQIRRQ